ncbi:MAG: hypothetical protein PXX73_04780 [Sideroxydans sp.]|nr:hypothetical protein [Sideroxydans sp.]
MAKKIYSVLSPVEFDHQRYEIGAEIELEEVHAEGLLGVNAIASSNQPLRAERIASAIAALDTEDSNLWLRDGKPSAEAIAAITGFVVSAAERNEAWAAIVAAQG